MSVLTDESFEYVDRNYDGRIVQIGMFNKITNNNQITKGDRFICPPSNEYKSGIVDSDSMQPILCFAKEIKDYHIIFSTLNGGRDTPAIAWDLCYLLKND